MRLYELGRETKRLVDEILRLVHEDEYQDMSSKKMLEKDWKRR